MVPILSVGVTTASSIKNAKKPKVLYFNSPCVCARALHLNPVYRSPTVYFMVLLLKTKGALF